MELQAPMPTGSPPSPRRRHRTQSPESSTRQWRTRSSSSDDIDEILVINDGFGKHDVDDEIVLAWCAHLGNAGLATALGRPRARVTIVFANVRDVVGAARLRSFDARLRPLSPDRFDALAACTVDELAARARARAPAPLVVRDVFLLAPCDLGPLVAAGLALHPAGRVYLQVPSGVCVCDRAMEARRTCHSRPPPFATSRPRGHLLSFKPQLYDRRTLFPAGFARRGIGQHAGRPTRTA